MADAAISALSSYINVADTDVVPIVDSGGVTKKVTVKRLNRKSMALSAADQVLTAGTTQQYLTGSAVTLDVAPNTLTLIQWKLIIEKTSAAGTAALVFNLRQGTAGTTADTARNTLTFNASTAAADLGRLDVMALFQSVGTGTSAILRASATFSHSLSTTGLINVPAQTLRVDSSGYDSTTGLIYGLSLAPGASNALTVRQCVAEAVNV